METVFGIDLGTTFSCIAAYHAGKNEIEVLRYDDNSAGNLTLPSVLQVVTDENGCQSLVVGHTALEAMSFHPENVARRTKRDILDDRLFDDETGEFLKSDRAISYPMFRGERMTPISVAKHIIKKLASDNPNVTRFTRGERPKVVITHPACTSPKAIGRIRQAAESAGLEVLGLIQEPFAGAFSYSYGADVANQTILVFDLGGGTLDITVARFNSIGKDGEVVVKDGDPNLGGENWDDAFAYHLWKRYIEKCGDNGVVLTEKDFIGKEGSRLSCEERNRLNRKLKTLNRFRKKANKAKHSLTDTHSVVVPLNEEEGIETTVTRDDFNKATSNLLDQAIGLLKAVLDKCRRDGVRITKVVLVGGSSLMPQIKETVASCFPRGMDIQCRDPHFAIAKGAALYAYSMLGKNQRLPVLLPSIKNISDCSVGVDAYVGDTDHLVMCTHIKKDQTLPASCVKCYQTREDGQKAMALDVYTSLYTDEYIELDRAVKVNKTTRPFKFGREVPKGTRVEIKVTMLPNGEVQIDARSDVAGEDIHFRLPIAGTLDEKGYERLSKM